ncbi:MAG: hypothetical protein COA86_03915 [Kangiella sp.]|nr:MAG: hypothetical protein COA86_04895 [Kangiella sp.]PHS19904.1 MAG: hypothetical protein COA86_03915 [Kangiella sp.]
MLQFKKQLTLLVLLFTLIQVGSAVAHEYSEAHLNDCDASLCTSHLLLDDFIDSNTYPIFYSFNNPLVILAIQYQPIKLQHYSNNQLSRAPPKQ